MSFLDGRLAPRAECHYPHSLYHECALALQTEEPAAIRLGTLPCEDHYITVELSGMSPVSDSPRPLALPVVASQERKGNSHPQLHSAVKMA